MVYLRFIFDNTAWIIELILRYILLMNHSSYLPAKKYFKPVNSKQILFSIQSFIQILLPGFYGIFQIFYAFLIAHVVAFISHTNFFTVFQCFFGIGKVFTGSRNCGLIGLVAGGWICIFGIGIRSSSAGL